MRALGLFLAKFRSAGAIGLAGIAAQVLMLAISPILARLYTPVDYAIFGVFFTFSSIAGLIVNLRFDLAVTAAHDRAETINLAGVSVFLAAFLSILGGVVFWFLSAYHLIGRQDSTKVLAMIMMLQLFAVAVSMTLQAYLIRTRGFRTMAQAQFMQGAGRGAAQLGFGFAGLGPYGLVLGEVAARLLQSLTIWAARRRMLLAAWRRYGGMAAARAAAKAHRHHTHFSTVATSLNAVAYIIPAPLILATFGIHAAGFYTFAERIVAGPLSLIMKSIGDVFQGQLIAELKLHGKRGLMQFYIKCLCVLAVAAVSGACVIHYATRPVFAILFGARWEMAGDIVTMMAPLFAVWVCSFSLAGVFTVARRQDVHCVFSVINVAANLYVLIVSVRGYEDFLAFMKLFVAVNTLVYAGYIAMQVYAAWRPRLHKPA